eukprot:PhM_4_TR13923/c0_g1_i1/m.70915/K13830/ARO1; pentafunctional AROM polypeptide
MSITWINESRGVGVLTSVDEAPHSSKPPAIAATQRFLQNDLLTKVLQRYVPSTHYIVVSDENVWRLWGSNMFDSWTSANTHLLLSRHIIPPGEVHKCRRTRDGLEDFLAASGCGRDAVLVALGGGVVGDLTGFVSATYMRGIRYVQIPTTVLSMVDSSVGGKTGIDLPQGKNLLGAFHNACLSIVCPGFIATLPRREVCNGFAEVVKTAFLDSHDFVDLVELEAYNLQRDPNGVDWVGLLTRCVKYKLSIVEQDEKETSGLRSILNLGHTIGHALESAMMPELLHGEAVAIGLVKEAQIGRRMGLVPQALVARLSSILTTSGLPVDTPTVFNLAAVQKYLSIDKKNENGEIKMVLLEDIGVVANGFRTLPVKKDIVLSVLVRSVTVAVDPATFTAEKEVTLRPLGSKSISNRVLEMAFLGRGRCRITGLLYSTDTVIMLKCLRALTGARVTFEDKCETIVVDGVDAVLRDPASDLFVGNSGTSARFLLSVCALLPEGTTATLVGCDRMNKDRPIEPLVEAIRSQGVDVRRLDPDATFPLQVVGGSGLKGGATSIDPSLSSQFVSSLLLAAAHAKADLSLRMTEECLSELYVGLTVGVMSDFGVHVECANGMYTVPCGGYDNPATVHVEPDASSASYLWAIAAITGTTVTVEGLGENSRQCDVYFPTSVLSALGCEVSFESTRTTVIGAENGRILSADLNMSHVTDTFLTAAVLLAGADGISTIRGIGTQRVKECNRIAAIIHELNKFGIHCTELDDGLEICGKPFDAFHEGVEVECYDDHRVAMAFAVLSFRVRGIVIRDASCVDKTYPTFWDDLLSYFGASVIPVNTSSNDVINASAASTFMLLSTERTTTPLRHLVADMCRSREWSFVDCANEDTLGEIHGRNRSLMKEREQTLPVAMLRQVIDEATQLTVPTIIHVPPSSVNDSVVSFLAGSGFFTVRHSVLVRDVDEPCSVPKKLVDATSLELVLESAGSFVRRCSTLIEQCARVPATIEELKTQLRATHMVSLTLPSFVSVTSEAMERITEGVDVVELRADFLTGCPCPTTVAHEISALRRAVSLPIMFTLRSKGHGGCFTGSEKEAMCLIQVALRMGCEYLDVEVGGVVSPGNIRRVIAHKGHTIVVLSYHDPAGFSVNDVRAYATIARDLGADVVKVVVTANSVQDCLVLTEEMKGLVPDRAYMALCMGPQGVLSRALNAVLTPVTHPDIPVPAAPGQLSLRGLNQLRSSLGLILPKDYFVLGHPVTASLSPLIHNTSFSVLGLPHRYDRYDTPTLDGDVMARLRSPNFGGASVTIPYKVDMMQLVDMCSEDVEAIGALNTIVPMGCLDSDEIVLFGENTDWRAIHRLVVRHTQRKNVARNALVLGAGGAARAVVFALLKAGCESVGIYNRTIATAREVSQGFPSTFVLDDLSVGVNGGWDVVVSTLPATVGTEYYSDVSIFSKPECVVIDMAYIGSEPLKMTPVLHVATCVNPTVRIVLGIDVLIEQALDQFTLWTCHTAPRHRIADAIRKRSGTTTSFSTQ